MGEVKRWLIETVKLEIYYDDLIEYGYECMDFIIKIQDKAELESIGIVKKGHLTRMMKQIQNLKNNKSMNVAQPPNAKSMMAYAIKAYHEVNEEEEHKYYAGSELGNESMYSKEEHKMQNENFNQREIPY